MKDKFIRCISPIYAVVSLVITASGVGLLVYAIKELMGRTDFYAVSFYIIAVLSVVLGFFMSKQAFSDGVRFYSDRMEFTGLDEVNVFEYEHIVGVDSYKDTSASFKKKMVERFSVLIIELDDDTSVTVTLGYTTKKTLERITAELKKRIKQ